MRQSVMQTLMLHRYAGIGGHGRVLCYCGDEFDNGYGWGAHVTTLVMRVAAQYPPVIQPMNGAPATSKRMLASAMKDGTVAKAIYDLLLAAGENGMTDDELEVALRRQHQSVSASRNRLVRGGLVEATDRVRKTRWGNDATVWRVA